MSSNIIEKLKEKKEKISSLQTKKARQEGQRDQLLQQLKEKFDVNSLEEGKKKLEELKAKSIKNEEKIEGLDNEMEKIISMATSKEKTTE